MTLYVVTNRTTHSEDICQLVTRYNTFGSIYVNFVRCPRLDLYDPFVRPT